jgi:N-acetylmuramoyl-L-alanine amidase
MKWFYVGAALLGAVSLMSESDGERVTAAVAQPTAAQPAPRGDGPLVVLDPGHGGTNAGAPGAVAGVHEKQVTLALAFELERRLIERGVAVALTRRDDRYLTLRQRSARANELGADLFISLHVNATPDHSHRGYETFVLSPRAVDIDARALRVEDGASRPGVDPEVALLLDEVERGAVQESAAELAVALQQALREVRGADGDRGVRQEAHHVLLGATMPAVLVEVGFIDHPLEGRELLDPAVRDQIADALADAIAGRVHRPGS